MFCNNCGFQLPDGTKFCNNCGKPTSVPQEPALNNQLPPELQSVRQQPVMQQTPIYAPSQQGGYAQPNAGYPLPPMDYSPIVTPPPKKKSKAPFIVLGVVVALVLVVIIGIITSGSSFTPEHGTIDGNFYTNESIEIKFEKPDGWIFATDEELAEMHDNEFEAEDYADLSALLDTNQYAVDMFVQSPLGNNIIVGIEDISAAPGVSYDEYVEAFMSETDMEVEYEDLTTKEIAGKEFRVANATAKTMGVNVPQRYYFRKYDNYMVIIALTALSDSAFNEMEDMFSAIE